LFRILFCLTILFAVVSAGKTHGSESPPTFYASRSSSFSSSGELPQQDEKTCGPLQKAPSGTTVFLCLHDDRSQKSSLSTKDYFSNYKKLFQELTINPVGIKVFPDTTMGDIINFALEIFDESHHPKLSKVYKVILQRFGCKVKSNLDREVFLEKIETTNFNLRLVDIFPNIHKLCRLDLLFDGQEVDPLVTNPPGVFGAIRLFDRFGKEKKLNLLIQKIDSFGALVISVMDEIFLLNRHKVIDLEGVGFMHVFVETEETPGYGDGLVGKIPLIIPEQNYFSYKAALNRKYQEIREAKLVTGIIPSGFLFRPVVVNPVTYPPLWAAFD